MMSGGGSKSSSKSNTQTSTSSSTQQADNRVAATDAGVAIGSGTQGSITINQLPDGLGDVVSGFIDLTHQAIQAAQDAGQVAVDTQTALNQTAQAQQDTAAKTQQYLIWGGLGLALFFVLKGKI